MYECVVQVYAFVYNFFLVLDQKQTRVYNTDVKAFLEKGEFCTVGAMSQSIT